MDGFVAATESVKKAVQRYDAAARALGLTLEWPAAMDQFHPDHKPAPVVQPLSDSPPMMEFVAATASLKEAVKQYDVAAHALGLTLEWPEAMDQFRPHDKSKPPVQSPADQSWPAAAPTTQRLDHVSIPITSLLSRQPSDIAPSPLPSPALPNEVIARPGRKPIPREPAAPSNSVSRKAMFQNTRTGPSDAAPRMLPQEPHAGPSTTTSKMRASTRTTTSKNRSCFRTTASKKKTPRRNPISKKRSSSSMTTSKKRTPSTNVASKKRAFSSIPTPKKKTSANSTASKNQASSSTTISNTRDSTSAESECEVCVDCDGDYTSGSWRYRVEGVPLKGSTCSACYQARLRKKRKLRLIPRRT
ncbi:hypothetical protein CF319_g4463 [Tilletia indica]|nr:hypothetical protein CF319_g4463 [Tilletia indica]